MARAATTPDVFNATAQPQRRNILVLLRAGERPVTEVARELGIAQPRSPKHLPPLPALCRSEHPTSLVLLRPGEPPVTVVARELRITQPGASKHLRVLREVGLVRDRKEGKQRLYDLDARGLRPVHEWAGGFERFWNESFDRLDAYVQDLKRARRQGGAMRAVGQGAPAQRATGDRAPGICRTIDGPPELGSEALTGPR